MKKPEDSPKTKGSSQKEKKQSPTATPPKPEAEEIEPVELIVRRGRQMGF